MPRSSRWWRHGPPSARVSRRSSSRCASASVSEPRRRSHRPAEAPLEHLREDGGARQGIRRHPRSRGHPRRGRLGEGLLGRSRGHPRHLAAGAGPIQDYINTPKFNLYQSLHTTVIGLDGKPIEVQVRTHEMHRRAEYGIAPLGLQGEGRRLLGHGLDATHRRGRRGHERPGRVLGGLEARPRADEVYVFTPKGR